MTGPSTDLDALRERYRTEREHRAGAAVREYRDVGLDTHLLVDPYTAPAERTPLDEETEVLIVGAGFGGLLAAGRLREAGVDDFRIVEAGGDVGGTWYWNRYPGAACDVESYIYFPLLEETGYMPVERYSKAAEIRAHGKRIADHYQLYPRSLFSTKVSALDWDEQAARWVVTTDRGDRIAARFVVLTTGPLNRPKLPAIPGIETFAGHSFHTSRWDYAYTGGTATEPMAGLADKMVGIIGTGATAVQCVPPLAASAKQLFVFQRTPSSVDARNNSLTDPVWAATLTPGWQQRRRDSFDAQLQGELHIPDEVGDGWTVLARAIREMLANNPQAATEGNLLERADLETMVRVRERIGSIVEDPATAEALKPWFSLYCKRPCFHDWYLQTFNRANVALVDTHGRGVERVTERGLVVDGREYPLDCLIFATGFEVSADYSKRAGFQMRGRGGVTLADKWAEGLSTYHGLHTRGFPNAFFVSQQQSGMSANFPQMLDQQSRHIAHIVAVCRARGVASVEASAAAESDWVDTIVDLSVDRQKFLESCTPGYYNNEGQVSAAMARSHPYGRGPAAFNKLLAEWREKGDFAGLELSGAIASEGADA